MTYIADLSPCWYFDWAEGGPVEGDLRQLSKGLVAVGWLDPPHPFPTGPTPRRVIRALFKLLEKRPAMAWVMGFHGCGFCAPHHDLGAIVRFGLRAPRVGEWNILVPGAGFVFIAPSMILHYILTHQYQPPVPFTQAVLDCPPLRGGEYELGVIQNGPAAFREPGFPIGLNWGPPRTATAQTPPSN